MKVIIMGCGRVGARLAALMEEDGHDVSIIDSNPAAFDRLPDDFKGQTVLGTGIDVDVLKAAGIEGTDAFAAVTNYDNTNIMACEVAKEIFGVDKVLARIYDPGRESFYHQLGLETVCPTTLVSTTARHILSFDGDDEDMHLSTGYVGGSGLEPTERSIDAVGTAPDSESQGSSASQSNVPPAATSPDGQTDGASKNGRGGLRGLFRP
jgi:trk system potassium uptake protein TrkA